MEHIHSISQCRRQACRILYVGRHARHTELYTCWKGPASALTVEHFHQQIAMRSCTAAPNATSQRLCCCASDCNFDAGYCAEGYSPNTQTAAPTGGSATNEDDTWMN